MYIKSSNLVPILCNRELYIKIASKLTVFLPNHFSVAAPLLEIPPSITTAEPSSAPPPQVEQTFPPSVSAPQLELPAPSLQTAATKWAWRVG